MANEVKDEDEAQSTGRPKSLKLLVPVLIGHPFLAGLVLGVIIGWWYRPPASFRMDELKLAFERKLTVHKDRATKKLAEISENFANKLREKAREKAMVSKTGVAEPNSSRPPENEEESGRHGEIIIRETVDQ